MAGKIEFSEKALNELNNGYKTRPLTGVKAYWTWFLLLSITLFFGAMIVWGFFGSMVESVSGFGITLRNEGVQQIVATGTGIVSHLNIEPGATVSAGQVIGQIYNPEMLFKTRQLESELELLKKEIAFLKEGTKKYTQLKVDYEKRKKTILDALVAEQKESQTRSTEITQKMEALAKAGAASRLSVFEALDKQLQAHSSLVTIQFQDIDSEISQNSWLWEQEQQLLKLEQEQEQKERELTLAQKLYREGFWLTSSCDGTILEIFTQKGSSVQNGEKIALIAPKGDMGIYLMAFVPPDVGKKVKNGMSAYFSPTAAPAAEYGYIKCVVRNVSSAPINAEMVQNRLQNSALTQSIAGQSAVIQVELELLPDAKSASGFAWTSNNGYPAKIVNGTLGNVIINTEYRPPASYVIPALREYLTYQKAKKQVNHE